MTKELFLQNIGEGNYTPHSLWHIITTPNQRDGYALGLLSFDGPGEYQRIEVNGVDYFVNSNTFDQARSKCPNCGAQLKINLTSKGDVGKCETCNEIFKSDFDKPFKKITQP